jgi:TolB-like protein
VCSSDLVLLALARRPGQLATKAELMQAVWPDVVVTDDSLVQAIGDIRRVLGDADRRLVRTVARRGYLLEAPVGALPQIAMVPAPAATESLPLLQGRAAPPSRPPHRWPRWLVAALLLGLTTVGLAWWTAARHTEAAVGEPRIAVLAFRDRSGTVEGAWLAEGLVEDLVMALGRTQGLAVVSHHSSLALAGQNLPSAELGRRLNARFLLGGAVLREGDRIELDVELVDAREDKLLWSRRLSSQGGAVVRSRDEILDRVAGSLRSTVRDHEKQRALTSPEPATLDVYSLTQKGLALKHRFTPQSMRDGRAALERAVSLDPNYAPAWWALGWLNSVDAMMGLSGEWTPTRIEEAIAQILRSTALDPGQTGAYVALGTAYEVAGRMRDQLLALQQAVAVGPGDSDAALLHGLALMHNGRIAEGMTEADRAMALSPIPPIYFLDIHANLARQNGRHEEARRETRTCLERAPKHPVCRFTLMLTEYETGNARAAAEHAEQLRAAGFPAAAACNTVAPETGRADCVELARKAGLPS